jgi:hypothetical protein
LVTDKDEPPYFLSDASFNGLLLKKKDELIKCAIGIVYIITKEISKIGNKFSLDIGTIYYIVDAEINFCI